MPTYTISQFKARASQILQNLEDGDEVIITLRGKPCAKLTAVPKPVEKKGSLASLRDSYTHLPDLDYAAFQEIKKIWEPRPLPVDNHGAE